VTQIGQQSYQQSTRRSYREAKNLATLKNQLYDMASQERSIGPKKLIHFLGF